MARSSRTRGVHIEISIVSPLPGVKNSRQYLPEQHSWREVQLVHLKGRALIDKSLPKSPSLNLQAPSLGGQGTFRTQIAAPEGGFELPPSTQEAGHWAGMLLFESICQSHMLLSLQHPIHKYLLNMWADLYIWLSRGKCSLKRAPFHKTLKTPCNSQSWDIWTIGNQTMKQVEINQQRTK